MATTPHRQATTAPRRTDRKAARPSIGWNRDEPQMRLDDEGEAINEANQLDALD